MRRLLISFVIVSAGTMVLSLNLGGYSIYILDEAKNAECAREMMEAGDWVVPTFNYQLRTDKPTLPYYFMIFSYKMFGVTAFAARFFSALCGGLLLMITYWFSRHYLGPRAAVMALVVLSSSAGFLVQYRLAVPDPYLVLFTTSSLLAFYHGLQTRQFKWFVMAYLTLGLAVMAKGPIGAIIPMVPVGMYVLLYERDSWRSSRPLTGLAIVLLIVLPWYVMVGKATDGRWLSGFFLEHNVTRYLVTREGHGGNPLLMPLFLVVLLFPSSVFLLQAGVVLLHRPLERLNVFMAMVVLTVVVFFAFSATKLPNYVSPALPFAAILVARYLSEEQDWKWSKMAGVVVLLILWIALALASDQLPEAFTNPGVRAQLLILPIAGGVAGYFFWTKRGLTALAVTGFSWMLVITSLFFTLVPRLDRLNPVVASVDVIDPSRQFVAYHIFNPAFSFHLKKQIPVFTDQQALGEYLEGKNEVVVLTRAHVLNELEEFGLDTLLLHDDLFERTQTAILQQRPTNP